MRELPARPRRIILVNPTRYLGNLLLAGGLIQSFAGYCRDRDIEFRLVVDAAFVPLLAGAFEPETLIAYPRAKIARAGPVTKARLYLGCVREIRRFHADIAFNIEEDSVSHRLTQLSGAGFRLGCSTQRHGLGYHQVLPVSFSSRPPGRQHRWYSFQEVFQALGLPESSPGYIRLEPAAIDADMQTRLEQRGLDFSARHAVLHTGATKLYKKWPHENFASLAGLLQQAGYQVVFIGAGGDAGDIEATLALLPAAARDACVNLCNSMNLAELASFLAGASLMAGNDSGPFHLAAALGVPGAVIFGPTREDLWGPLSERTRVLKDSSVCHPDCTRKHCLYQHRCLRAITADQVFTALRLLQPD